MPKKTNEDKERSNRIKFVLVEADISDSNLSQLTQAITSALRPTIVLPRQVRAGVQAPALQSGDAFDDVEIIEPDATTEAESYEEEESSRPKPSKPRKSKQPDYDDNLFSDPAKGKAFKAFVEEKQPDSRAQKYVCATYWLKENGISSVNADKMYTCFKTAGWPMNFTDWLQTFHNLVHSSHLKKLGNAEFAITPFGEDSILTPSS